MVQILYKKQPGIVFMAGATIAPSTGNSPIITSNAKVRIVLYTVIVDLHLLSGKHILD